MGTTSKHKVRVGIIGLGGVAQAHLKAFELLDSVRLVAVCDVRAEIAEEVGGQFSAKAYTEYSQLLATESLDLVMVLTPASTHRAIVEAIAAVGFHVFCEKPIAVTIEDGEAMVSACKDAGVKLFYGSCYRYLPALVKARALMQSDAIGEVQLLTEQLVGGHGAQGYEQLSPIHYPLGGPGGAGMGLMDHGVHLVDIFPWLTDSEIVAVQGIGQVSGEAPVTEYLCMQLTNGAVGHLLYNAATYTTALPNEGMFSGGQGYLSDSSITEAGVWESEPGSISVYGTSGSLRIFHYTNALFINDGQGPRQVPLSGRPAFGHFATQLEDCAEVIKYDLQPNVTGADGLKALVGLLQVYRRENLK